MQAKSIACTLKVLKIGIIFPAVSCAVSQQCTRGTKNGTFNNDAILAIVKYACLKASRVLHSALLTGRRSALGVIRYPFAYIYFIVYFFNGLAFLHYLSQLGAG